MGKITIFKLKTWQNDDSFSVAGFLRETCGKTRGAGGGSKTRLLRPPERRGDAGEGRPPERDGRRGGTVAGEEPAVVGGCPGRPRRGLLPRPLKRARPRGAALFQKIYAERVCRKRRAFAPALARAHHSSTGMRGCRLRTSATLREW